MNRISVIDVWLQLPDDVVCRVLEKLDVTEVARLAQTCKKLRLFCQEAPLWKYLALKSANERLKWKGTWFRTAVYAAKGEVKGAWFAAVSPLEGFQSDYLYRRWYRSHMDVLYFRPKPSMERPIGLEDGAKLSLEDFVEKYEVPSQPVLLHNVQELEGAMKWNVPALEARYGKVLFAVGGNERGVVQMELREYMEHVHSQTDEGPLYLFESDLNKVPAVVEDYTVPAFFQRDLMSLMECQAARPDYRWLLVGPARSGSAWHLDPLTTGAWNCLVTGTKRWALYPPGKIPPGVHCSLVSNSQDEDLEIDSLPPLQWFLEVLPQLKEKDKPIEFVQSAGQTVFVPHGWWHCVLNLETTVSITQNFVPFSQLRSAIHMLSQSPYEYYSAAYAVKNAWMRRQHRLPRIWTGWIGHLMRGVWKFRPELRVSLFDRVLRPQYAGLVRQEELWTCAEDFVYARELSKSLSEICERHGLPAPQRSEIFPLYATSNFLFRVQDYTIKLFLHLNPLNLCIQQLAESFALSAIQRSDPASRSWCPEFVAAGVVMLPITDGTLIEAPYLVETHCVGEQVSYKLNGLCRTEIAKRLGHSTARLHTAQVLAPAPETSNGGHVCSSVELLHFENLQCCLDFVQSRVVSGGAFFQAQHPNRAWSQGLGSQISVVRAPEGNQSSCIPGSFCLRSELLEPPDLGAWSPFLGFLKWRHRLTLHHPSGTSLPPHLADQVKIYLPSRVEDLIPRPDPVTGRRVPPSLLHGDLTCDNVLVSGGADQSLCIVDFADAGFGDPLYDFVATSLSTLQSDAALIETFARHYWSACEERMSEDQWRCWRRSRILPVSYCIMCYALLHEDRTMRWLFDFCPEGNKCETLSEIQRKIWGKLDAMWSS